MSTKDKSIAIESSVFLGLGVKMGMTANGHHVSFQGDGFILTDFGDGCTTW